MLVLHYCPTGIVPLGNSARSLQEKPAATESSYPTFSALKKKFSSIHRTLTWTIGSLMCECNIVVCLNTENLYLLSTSQDIRACGIGETVGVCTAQLWRSEGWQCRFKTVNRLGVDSCVFEMARGYLLFQRSEERTTLKHKIIYGIFFFGRENTY